MFHQRLPHQALRSSISVGQIQQTYDKKPRSHRRLIMAASTLLLLIVASQLGLFAQTDDTTDEPDAYQVFLPLVQGKQISVQRIQPIVWDNRLTDRGAYLEAATVAAGEGYWRLIEAKWFDHTESQGRHHILIDSLDANGQRQSGVPIEIRWNDGSTTIKSEEKAGEPFAANYAMYALAPAYSAQPADGAPADRIEGMGLGELAEPHLAFHTSYGLIWRWTIAGDELVPTVTPIPTVTVTAPITVTPPVTGTEGVTGTPTVIATPPVTVTPIELGTPAVTQTPAITATDAATATPVPSVTPTPSTTSGPSVTPTPSATSSPSPASTPTMTPTTTPTTTPTASITPQRFTAILVNCTSYQNGSRFEGHVTIGGERANGYNITFSYEPDGPKVPQHPAISGSDGEPGHYAHILGAGVARVGDWAAWMVDGSGQRISTIAIFHTDGATNRCNNATVDFMQP